MKTLMSISVAFLLIVASSKDPGFLIRAPFCLAAHQATALTVGEYMTCGLWGWRMSDVVNLYRRTF